MYKIRMIDNDLDLCRSIKAESLKRNFDFDFCTDLESGMAMLGDIESEADIIILDGKGFLKKGDTTENSAHIVKGISQFRKLLPSVSIALYTAHLDIVKEHIDSVFDEKIPILGKSEFNSPSLLMQEVISLIENSEMRRLQNKYKDLFEIFELGYLLQGTKAYDEFIEILKMIEEDSFSSLNAMQIKGYLTSIRAVQEHIYLQIYDYHPGLFEHLSNSFKDMNFVLRGSKSKASNYKATSTEYQEEPIANLVDAVHRNVGSYIHYIKNGADYFQSPYGLKALAFSLFEVMMWYKNGNDTDLFKN